MGYGSFGAEGLDLSAVGSYGEIAVMFLTEKLLTIFDGFYELSEANHFDAFLPPKGGN